MARSHTHPTNLDRLDPAQRESILIQLLQGVPDRVVAGQIGISIRQLQRYRSKHLKPVLAVANQISKLSRMSDQVSLEDIPTAVRTIAFAERLEKAYERTNKVLDYVEGDVAGEYRRPELAAGILNQLHRNLKLHGVMSGELQSGQGLGSVTIVVPQPPAGARPAVNAAVIDIRPPRR